MIDSTFVREIERLALDGAAIETIDGQPFSIRDYKRIRQDLPEPETLTIHTLKSFVEYIADNPDRLTYDDCIIIVEPARVSLVSRLQAPEAQRFNYLQTVAETPNAITGDLGRGFALNKWLEPETFIIGLQTFFEPRGNRADLLQLTSTLGTEAVVKVADDGITQETQARVGTIRVTDVKVPNPVELYPFRTFREVPQPRGLFVFRLRQDAGRIQAALFDCDGGEWKAEAIQNIKDYLAGELALSPLVIG